MAVAIWAYLSPMPFAWCRVFFGLRGHRSLGRRWLLATAIAPVWPLFGLQYVISKRHGELVVPDTVGDQIESEFRALYP